MLFKSEGKQKLYQAILELKEYWYGKSEFWINSYDLEQFMRISQARYEIARYCFKEILNPFK